MKDEMYFIKLMPQEATVIDTVLTLHSWDKDTLEYLMEPWICDIRSNAGRVILQREGTLYIPDKWTLEWLLTVIPIERMEGSIPAGLQLKQKLYRALLGLEEEDANKYTSAGTSDPPEGTDRYTEDEAPDSPPDSTPTPNTTLST